MRIGSFIKNIIQNRNDTGKLKNLKNIEKKIEAGTKLSSDEIKLARECTEVGAAHSENYREWSQDQKNKALGDIKKAQEKIIERSPAIKELDAEIKILEERQKVWEKIKKKPENTIKKASNNITKAEEAIDQANERYNKNTDMIILDHDPEYIEAKATIAEAKEKIKDAYKSSLKEYKRTFERIFKKEKKAVVEFNDALKNPEKIEALVAKELTESAKKLEAKKVERKDAMQEAQQSGELPKAKQQERGRL